MPIQGAVVSCEDEEVLNNNNIELCILLRA